MEDEGLEMASVSISQEKYRKMQTEVRDHLKTRLPVYAVPNIYIVLNKLPLNPNCKFNKPNLPSPDVIKRTEEASEDDLKDWDSLTLTEQAVAQKWAELVRGLNPKTNQRDNSFFDMGGHSLLAQQLLLMTRKELGTNVSINTLYDYPTLGGFSAQIERVKGSISAAKEEGEPDYAIDILAEKSQSADAEAIAVADNLTVFLTGATDFLGFYLIKEVLNRTKSGIKLIAHVRGARNPTAALERIQCLLRATDSGRMSGPRD